MARKNHIDDLIHCEVCGEDYSPTYRRCPFCGEKPAPRPDPNEEADEDDGYVFDGQDLFDDEPRENNPSGSRGGGKRLAGSSSRRPSGGGRHAQAGPISWIRLVTYLISLVIIIAALIIVFTVFYPKLHKNPNPGSSVSPTVPVSQEPVGPSAEPSGEPTDQPTAEPSDQPTASVSTLNGIALDTYDFTLREGESYTIKVTLNPADWDGELTWSSSDTNYATVDSNGKVTNVNPTTSLRRVTITVTGGGQSAECTVYCRGTNSGATAPPVVTSPAPGSSDDPGSSDTLAPGSKGVIVGAASGLRVRSGPGTTYEVLASLRNGDQVTIVESAGNGWYKITYGGSSTGYIMGQYISAR